MTARPFTPTPFEESVHEKLTTAERITVYDEAAALKRALDERKEKEKNRRSKWKKKTDRMDAKVTTLLKQGEKGERTRKVICRHEAHLDSNELLTIDTSNNRVLEQFSRPLNSLETNQIKQMGFQFDSAKDIAKQRQADAAEDAGVAAAESVLAGTAVVAKRGDKVRVLVGDVEAKKDSVWFVCEMMGDKIIMQDKPIETTEDVLTREVKPEGDFFKKYRIISADPAGKDTPKAALALLPSNAAQIIAAGAQVPEGAKVIESTKWRVPVPEKEAPQPGQPETVRKKREQKNRGDGADKK